MKKYLFFVLLMGLCARFLSAVATIEKSGKQCQCALGEQLLRATLFQNIKEVKRLLAQGAPVNYQNKRGNTPLFVAASQKSSHNQEIIKALLTARADVDCATLWGHTPLMNACEENNGGAAILLLDAGADCDRQDCTGNTALIYAVTYGHGALVRLLIVSGAHVNISNNYGETAWTISVKENMTREQMTEVIQQALMQKQSYS